MADEWAPAGGDGLYWLVIKSRRYRIGGLRRCVPVRIPGSSRVVTLVSETAAVLLTPDHLKVVDGTRVETYSRRTGRLIPEGGQHG